ncbi:MAG TPA: 3-oxoacyl-[acyl-carrier-protein] synthase III C-terminal domain-containing protein [Candidatus Bathyarchaeia archaeon]|nr:3-oxoacyl-[acyl-carrier-protein] synthase III C-terminal domain-containing protein [Candidatus Bathyarchaeia archaeon]
MRIVSSTTFVPEYHYDTEDLLCQLPLRLSEETLKSIRNLNVESRNFAYPISTIIDGSFKSKFPDRSFYQAKVVAEKIGLTGSIGFLIASCNAQDYICPNISSMLLRPLRLGPETRHCTLQGYGCTSFIIALQLAEDYIARNREKQVLIVTSEVNSMLFAADLRKIVDQKIELKPGTQEWVTLVETVLFGDGAAATLVSNDEGKSTIRPLLHVTNLEPDDYKLGMAGSNFYLSSEIPSAGIRYTRFLLEQLQLDARAFKKIILHTGSKKILDSLIGTLGCRPEAAEESYRVLREHGNLSGASLQFIMKEGLNAECSALMLGFGLGFHAGAAVIE